MKTELTVNGTRRSASLMGHENLLFVLREAFGLRSVKGACEEGECGSCSVLLDGKAVCACLVLAADAEGSVVVTTEGMSAPGDLNRVQEALLRSSGVQCGFCTPGFVVSIGALLAVEPHPSDAEIRESLAGNLCRCTGYQSILEAVRQLSEEPEAHRGADDDG